MIEQKLSASIFLFAFGECFRCMENVFRDRQRSLFIAVEAFDNQTHPYSKERSPKGNSKRNVSLHATTSFTAAGTFDEAAKQKRFVDMSSEEIFRCAVTALGRTVHAGDGMISSLTRNVAATLQIT